MQFDYPEFADNPENRCPVVLVLDTSESMEGEPIQHLNRGLADFKYQIEKDPIALLRVEVALVTFGGEPRVLAPFSAVDRLSTPHLKAEGRSPMGEAVLLALELIEERQRVYRAQGIYSFRPWIFLMTDGAPTDPRTLKTATERIRLMQEQHKILFFAVAVPGADVDCLRQMSGVDNPPIILEDTDFRSLFSWLSVSVRDVSRGRGEGAIQKWQQVQRGY